MDSFKWADVAHYYQDIEVVYDWAEGKTAVASRFHKGVATLAYTADDRHGSNSGCKIYGTAGASEYTPILRHCDDITVAEAIELYNFVYQFDDPETYGRICLGWARNNIAAGKYTPRVLHWLFSHGFDMFALIESGQAIRKPTDKRTEGHC